MFHRNRRERQTTQELLDQYHREQQLRWKITTVLRPVFNKKADEEEKKDIATLTTEQAGLEKARRETRYHFRGYYYASRVDLQRVDLDKLFHLPSKEVRRRFFTGDPDYSGLEKEGLETDDQAQ